MHNSSRTRRRELDRRAKKAARKAAGKAASTVYLQAKTTGSFHQPPLPDPPSVQLKSRLLTEGRLKANRANSLLSTGPKTATGKAASSLNRLTHGLVVGTRFQLCPTEDASLYAFQRNELIAEYQPATPSEHLLVERMAQHNWLQERALHLQLRCFGHVEGEIIDEKRFHLYERYALSHERAFHRNLAMLLKLQKERQNRANGFVRLQQAAELHEQKVQRLKLANQLRELRIQRFETSRKSAKLASPIPISSSRPETPNSAPQNLPFLRLEHQTA